MPWLALVQLALLALAGFGITYLCGLPLLAEERLFYGTVLGPMVGTMATFLAALAVGLGPVSIAAGTAVALAAGVAGLLSRSADLVPDVVRLGRRWGTGPWRARPWPLLLVVAIAWPYTVRLVGQALFLRPDGLWVGSYVVLTDWAAHLNIAASFAYGANLPPEWFVDPGHPLAYPFMIDFLSAELVRLGASLTQSLVLTSGMLGLALPGVLYLAAQRIIGGRLAGVLAAAIFLMSGGLGFLYLLPDIDRYGFRSLLHLPHDYTVMPSFGIIMRTATLFLLPERSLLFGVPIVLIVLALLVSALSGGGWRTFAFAGTVVGLAPLFHVHGFGTALLLPAFWAVFDRRREWLAFFIPALLLAAPAVLFATSGVPHEQCPRLLGHGPCLDVGWLAASTGRRNVLWFWLENAGLFVPLLVAAQLLPTPIRAGIGRLTLPMWLWFLVPQIWQLHPYPWDNAKYILYWMLVGSLPVAGMLAWVARRSREGAVLSAILVTCLCASGALDLARAVDLSAQPMPLTDTGGLAAAAWVRTHTDARAHLATSQDITDPVMDLSGRRTVIGTRWLMLAWGLTDYPQRERELEAMLHGSPGAAAIAHRDGVGYVVLGPQEPAAQRIAAATYWDRHGTLVYHNDEYRIYRVSPPS